LGSYQFIKTTKRQLGKVNTLLNEKLQQVEWGEFKIGDLFEIGTGSLIDLKSAPKGKVPRISVKTTDNGIIGYFDESVDNARYFENFISVNFFGISYYHPYQASVEMKVHTLKFQNRDFTKAEGIFISAMINKRLAGFFSYGSQLSSSKLKNDNLKIQLPTKSGKIDFEFMENFIKELETERINQLDSYLSVTGLKDYNLTFEEKMALTDYEKGEWKTFNLEALFGKATRGRRLKSADRISGTLPFVTAGETDEGISAFIGNNVKIFPNNTITIDMFGSAKYRNYNYGGDDHIAVVHSQHLQKFASIFVTTAIHKTSYNGQFNYGNNFYAKDADELNISLPTINNKPDYKLMETLISAIQKLVIKDVALYVNNKKNG
jgi:hypothetical protein